MSTSIKLKLNGYWGNRSAHVTGDMVRLYDIIRRKLIETGHTICNKRPPHIEVTDLNKPRDMAAYDSINNRMINISNMNGWILSREALMLNTGKTIYGKDTHFTIAYFPKKHNFIRNQIEAIINESINEYINK